MDKSLKEAVITLSQLNSYLKSKQYRENSIFSHPKDVIYQLKRLAIKKLDETEEEKYYRRIKVAVTCNTCGGTGIYTHFTGHEGTCRKCGGTGKVLLRFVESTFPKLGINWHTPHLRFPFIKSEVPSIYNLVTDWQPNAWNKMELEPWEVAKLLNQAEGYFGMEPIIKFHDFYSYNAADYKLWIGNSTNKFCVLCGSTENLSRYITARNKLVFGHYICRQCSSEHGKRGSSRDIIKNIDFPKHLAENIEIKKWERRHEAIR